MDCIFCKIIGGEIPNYTVWEDETVLAFLDIHPMSKGHTVVIPKKHFATIWDMSTEDFDAVAHSLRAVAGRVQARLKPDGMNIGINIAEAGGQTVPHVHWHVVPRYTNDGGKSVHAIVQSKDPIDVKAIAEFFKNK